MTLTKENNPFTPGRCARHPMPPLQYAVCNIRYAGTGPIPALPDAGVELDAADAHGKPALHKAVYEHEPTVYALLAQAVVNQHVPDKSWLAGTPAMAFEEEFGLTCEEKFKGMTIDAAYFRKEAEDL